MTDQERLKLLQEKERARASKAYPQSEGPPPGSILEGQRGVPEGVPLQALTPEQRKRVDYTPYGAGTPRLPRSGLNAWDGSLNDGQGGYVPRAPAPHSLAATQTWADEGDDGLNNRARAFGIDASAYGPEARAKLEADVAAAEQRHERMTKGGKYTIEPLPGGGHRYKPGAPMLAQEAARRKTSALRTLATRFQREMNADRNNDGRPDFNYSDLEMAYDDPSLEGMDHTARMRHVNEKVADQFRTDRAMNIQQAMEQRAKQDNMARRLNTSVANVTFHDDMVNAKTPEDRIRALLAYHAQNPNLGMGNMAAYIQRGQDEARAMDAMAAREDARARAANPVLSSPQDQEYIDSLPLGPGRMEARKNAVRKGYPGGAAPPEAVHDSVVNGEVDNVRALAAKKGLTSDEMSHIREWTGSFIARNGGKPNVRSFEAWSKMLGIPPHSPQSIRLWRIATGQDAKQYNTPAMPDDIYYNQSPMNPLNWWNGPVQDPRNLPDPGA